MGKLFAFLSIGTVVVASFAVAACVGDEPSSAASGTVVQGQLGGPCFANGTCNAGLSCDLVEGEAKCAASSGTPSGDASSVNPPQGGNTGTSDAATSGPPVCNFQTTSFPCGDQMPPNACYGLTQGCTLTGCSTGEIAWQCNSARQCGTACCVSTAAATLTAGAGCTQGTLLIAKDASTGATCSSDVACAQDATQLCQANSDCPPGNRCTPVKIIGDFTALSGTIVAACVPSP